MPPRGRVATLATIAAGLCPIIAALLTSDSVLQARIAVSGIGLVLLSIGTLRPPFAWKYDEGWRWLLGDRAFAAMFIVLGALVMIFAWRSPIAG